MYECMIWKIFFLGRGVVLIAAGSAQLGVFFESVVFLSFLVMIIMGNACS